MIIVDVESSGVDTRKCSLLSVGALDFDNPHNQFYRECRVFDGAHIEDEALQVNGFTRESCTDPKKVTDREVVEEFLTWMKTCNEWTLAGQNPSFDRDFLRETAHRYHLDWPLAQRTVDLHTVAYYEFAREGKTVPLLRNHSALNLEAILEHVGLPIKRESHNALEDSKLEAEAFSRFMAGKPLFEEYMKFKVPDGIGS
ncbi:MAG: 3'-5' exonuclease [bacterium]|nr:3'-5' exonuclease [bacterium]